MRPLRVAIVGFGKIAADQHAPAIAANPRLELVASVSRSGAGPGLCFSDYRDLLSSGTALDAVAITTPPSVRYDIARGCIAAGLPVLLEKPPAATLSEAEDLACLADAQGVTLYATWHAQMNASVGAAAEALAGRRIASLDVIWHEDVHKWHPGQQWIWAPGGFGVFDPGINAFSILTRIFPGSLFVRSAALEFPSGSHTPIAAEIDFSSPVSDGPLHCSLDWRRPKDEEWTIRLRCEDGREVALLDGGAGLRLDGQEQPVSAEGEYPAIYDQFVQLIDERRSLVDLRPLRLVADALLVARHTVTDAIMESP